MELPSTKRIIADIKAVAAASCLSAEQIQAITVRETNISPSPSTIRRLLEPDSADKYGFRYEDILRPIYMALVKDQIEDESPTVRAKFALYESIITYNDELIEVLKAQVADLQGRLDQQKAEYEKAREFFMAQIKHKDNQMHKKDERMDRKDELLAKREAMIEAQAEEIKQLRKEKGQKE